MCVCGDKNALRENVCVIVVAVAAAAIVVVLKSCRLAHGHTLYIHSYPFISFLLTLFAFTVYRLIPISIQYYDKFTHFFYPFRFAFLHADV